MCRQELHDTGLELAQLTIERDTAFGKDAQQVTLIQHLARLRKSGLVGDRVFALRRDGDGLGQAEQRAEHRYGKDAVIHDETDGPGAGGHQEHGVYKAHVVAHQDGRALGGDMFFAAHLEAVDAACEHKGQKAQQILRHQQKDVQRHHGVQQTHDQEHLRDAQAQAQRQAHADGADDHEERIQDVVGRNDAGAVRGQRAHLDERVHGHAVNARKEREQGQVSHHTPVRAVCQKAPKRVLAGCRQGV